MEIKLTDEQMNQALQEGWCEITHTSGFRIYCEIDSEGRFQYGEYYPPGKGKRDAFYFDADDIRRKTPRRPSDPSYYHNDPLCPIKIVDESDKPHEDDFCSFAERRTDESD